MEEIQSSQAILTAAEPIIRFVSKKLAYDDTRASSLEKATAKRAVEAAAWSVCVAPETADILNDSPAVRAEMLKLLDLEHDEMFEAAGLPDGAKARWDFMDSIRTNPRLFVAMTTLAPDLAARISTQTVQ